MRNALTHLNADSPEFNGGDLVFLTESVYAVLRMLLDCGVAIDTLTQKPIQTRFTGIAAAWHNLLSACANN